MFVEQTSLVENRQLVRLNNMPIMSSSPEWTVHRIIRRTGYPATGNQ